MTVANVETVEVSRSVDKQQSVSAHFARFNDSFAAYHSTSWSTHTYRHHAHSYAVIASITHTNTCRRRRRRHHHNRFGATDNIRLSPQITNINI